MRIAVIADIHGNLRALEAVRADLRRQAPDLVVNLGDHVSGPLQAAATADLLIEAGYLAIRGNLDRQLLDGPPDTMGFSDRAAFGQLTSRHKAWLAGLPATKLLDEQVLLCHGTPRDDLEYLLEETHQTETRLASAERIRLRLGNTQAPLVFCGHSHIPRIVSTADGVTVVNPGSVGLPAYNASQPLHYVETGSQHARYAIVDRDAGGVKVDFVALEYDWASAAKDAAAAHRPDWAHALRTGYTLRA